VSEAQEKNKALVRRFLEAQARGEVDTVKEMMAPEFVAHEWSQEEPDHRERYLTLLAEEQAAFSNIRYIIEDQIAEGDKVMTRWRGRGIHDRGEYVGLAPTGREGESKVIDVHRVEGGKITDEWKGTNSVENVQAELLAQVERERERIEQELQVARSIQQASLPKEVPILYRRAGLCGLSVGPTCSPSSPGPCRTLPSHRTEEPRRLILRGLPTLSPAGVLAGYSVVSCSMPFLR
jgi:predicted ester cyclase